MSQQEPSRRTVLRGSALGAGALIGAAGLTGTAHAATPPEMAAAVSSTSAPVGDQYFLKLDGIPGDSAYKGLENYIELSDFSWGASRSTRNGVARGKATPDEIQFRAPSSKASPLLLRNTVTGERIRTGMIVVANSQGNQFYKVTFNDLVISSYRSTGQDEQRPDDHGTLSFGRVKFAFYGQGPKGELEPPVVAEGDIRGDTP